MDSVSFPVYVILLLLLWLVSVADLPSIYQAYMNTANALYGLFGSSLLFFFIGEFL